MSRCTILITNRAKKDIDALPDNVFTRAKDAISDVIAKDPLSGKPLKGELKGLYSYRIGDHRIIYSFNKGKLIIWIIKVMHRRDVYK